MKHTFYKIVAAVCFMSAASASFAFDWGLSLDNASNLSGQGSDDLAFSQTEKASLWCMAAFSDSLRMDVYGYYRYKYWLPLADDTMTSQTSQLLDVTEASITFKKNLNKSKSASLSAVAGRFTLADASASVFNQSLDGIMFNYVSPKIVLRAAGGYTGLINVKSNSVHSLYYVTDDETPYQLGSKYIISTASATMQALFLQQTLGMDFVGCWNMNDDMQGDGKQRMYATMTLNGPIVSHLYYSCASTVGMMLADDLTVGDMTKATVTYFMPNKSLSIDASALYVTKDFIPFTYISASLDDNYSLNNLFKAGTSFSIKPVDSLQVAAGIDYLSPLDGGALTAGMIQWQSSLKWKIVSDVIVSLAGGQIVPLSDEYNSYYTGTLRAVFYF